MNDSVVSIKVQGGIGNMMFQTAFALAYSMVKNCKYEILDYELNLQLLEIFKEIGLRATSYSYSDERGNRQKLYRIAIRGNEMFDKFMEIIQPANPKHIKKYFKFKESFK